LKEQEEKNKSEIDMRKSGKQIFLDMKGIDDELEDLTLDEDFDAEAILADKRALEQQILE